MKVRHEEDIFESIENSLTLNFGELEDVGKRIKIENYKSFIINTEKKKFIVSIGVEEFVK